MYKRNVKNLKSNFLYIAMLFSAWLEKMDSNNTNILPDS